MAEEAGAFSVADIAAFCDKYAVTGENVVTAEVATIQDLADLLTGQLRKVCALSPDRPTGRQEMLCAADVAEALAGVVRESAEGACAPLVFPGRAAFYPPPVRPLTDIPVIVTLDSPPGTWRLVTHDRCEVRNADDIERARVSHAECTITAEGCLS